MKLRYIYLILIACICFSCESGTSQNPNYITDVEIDNNKLSCNGIMVENYTGNITKSEFTYGEKITVWYDNITGFALKNGLAYPNMDIFTTNKKGDTIMSQNDLLKDTEKGYTEKDLNLRSNLTFATPMTPGNSYTMHVHITDKNSDAYFNLKRDFSIIQNPLLDTKTNGMTYNILYLYSQTRNIAVVDNKIRPNENIYILLENLQGYDIDESGKVTLSASISLTAADGKVINEVTELFPESVSAVDLKDQLYATLVITDDKVSNPVTCVFKVKDTSSGNTFETSFKLNVTPVK